MSSALTSTITEDLGITTNQINIGSQLLSAGIVITEIPSNIILQKIGPQKWISYQLFAWGFVATFQAFIENYPAYLATRLLLGLFEGGFIPGMSVDDHYYALVDANICAPPCTGALYYLSTWYKREETSFRVSLFFFGQMFASATSRLISAGLLNLSGRHGLAGWRWIFLGKWWSLPTDNQSRDGSRQYTDTIGHYVTVEGLITIFAAIVFTLFLPPSVVDSKPLISGGRWSYFTERQTHILRNRVLLDDPRKARGDIEITGRDIWNTIRQPQIIQHCFVTLVAMSGMQALTTYTPSLIESFGFSAIRANVLASVPVYCGMVWLLILANFG